MKGFDNEFTTIENVSDIRRLTTVGKIRLGIKVSKMVGTGKNKKKVEYPKEVDYFVCPPEVEAKYGKKPKALDIFIPINDLNVIFPQAYKWYVKSGLMCIGNGIKAKRKDDKSAWNEMECPCSNLKTKDNPKGVCTKVANFRFILHKVNAGAVYQIDTGSIHSIIDIQSGLEVAAELFYSATGHRRFNMIPLILKRVERETHGSGRKETHYTMVVELGMTVDELNQSGQNPRFIQGGDMKFLLDAPTLKEAKIEIFDDAEDIPTEFEPVTEEEQKKIDDAAKEKKASKRVVEPVVVDPLKMTREKLMEYLKNECGKRYLKPEYDKIKKDMFGNTVVSKITLKMFQDLYSKLEAGAKDETKKK